jgi:phenylalanyl-tRNA synthetase beta chain
MPTVNVNKKAFCAALGENFTEPQFEDLCFAFGIELDAVTVDEAGETVWKIEIAANRYDLLCIEGLARALRIFLNKEPTPVCTHAGITGWIWANLCDNWVGWPGNIFACGFDRPPMRTSSRSRFM